MSLCPADAGPTSPAGSGLREEVAVGGPLCESGDIFTQTDGGFVETRDLPVASVGDLLVIEIAGAYGFVMASNYNSKPLPAEVLVDGGQARLVRAPANPRRSVPRRDGVRADPAHSLRAPIPAPVDLRGPKGAQSTGRAQKRL